ncbi:MAG: YczE/YyaS/YitT family protein [Lachnospiraceae bacterium]|jgi:uncharacterized membrane protein YczE
MNNNIRIRKPDRMLVLRLALYFLGMVILAFGICLNSQTALGVTPIVSVAYVISDITGWSFGDTTLIEYSAFVLIEVIIHCASKKYRQIIPDLLQIAVSIIFTRFMNLFTYIIPNFRDDLAGTIWAGIPIRIVFLVIAIVMTGVGAALSLNMRIIPNPGDGIVLAISDTVHKSVGFVKNCVDISCVCITALICVFVIHGILGIGIGTIAAMIGVGRVIALFNYLVGVQNGTGEGIVGDR